MLIDISFHDIPGYFGPSFVGSSSRYTTVLRYILKPNGKRI